MSKSNFELNIVAQPGTITAVTLSNIETMNFYECDGNTTTHPRPATAVHDLGAGVGPDSDKSSLPSSPAKIPPENRTRQSASQPGEGSRDRSREMREEHVTG